MKTKMKTETNVRPLIEELAYMFLIHHGYKVLLRSYECPEGTADIIAKDGGTLVFVAVNASAAPLLAVSEYYTKRYGVLDTPVRIDTLKVTIFKDREPVFDLSTDLFDR